MGYFGSGMYALVVINGQAKGGQLMTIPWEKIAIGAMLALMAAAFIEFETRWFSSLF